MHKNGQENTKAKDMLLHLQKIGLQAFYTIKKWNTVAHYSYHNKQVYLRRFDKRKFPVVN
jgi:hypothetical protein